jgi:DNA-binding beta-propeller fold protein YncE
MNHKWITFRLTAIGIIVAIALVGMLYVDQNRASASNDVQTVLFSDDFSSDLSQWSVVSGNWYIDQEELVGSTEDLDAWIFAGDTSWIDYALQVKVIFTSDNAILGLRSTNPGENEYWLSFWQQGGENSNGYSVYKFQDGQYFDLGGGTSPVPITNPSVIQVQVDSNRIFIYINGKYAAEIDDPNPLLSGRISLAVPIGNGLRFDDVLVTTLPPIMLMPPEQEMYGRAGDTVTYTLELENHTGATDSFSLDVLPGNAWTTTLITDTVGPIEDGESITFTVSVDLPLDAMPGISDTATIQAASVNNPIDTATAILNTTAASGELAYVNYEGNSYLSMVDTVLHVVLDTIDLAPYGCTDTWSTQLTPDGRFLYIACYNANRMLVLDTGDLSLVANIYQPGWGLNDFAFTQDGAYAIVTSDQSRIDVINTSTYMVIKTIQTSGYNYGIVVHPYMPRAYIANGDYSNGYVLVMDTTDFTIMTSIHHGADVPDVAISPDGRHLFASEYTTYGGIAVIDTQTNSIITVISGLGDMWHMEITPDGSRLFAAAGWWNTVHVIDAVNFTYITSIGTGGITFDVKLNSDGSKLFVADHTNTVPVIDTSTYNIVDSIQMPAGETSHITINPQYVAEGAFLFPPSQSEFAEAGETLTYTLQMVNQTGITDSYTLTVLSGNTFTTTLSDEVIGPIDDGGIISFTAWVDVPPGASPGDTDTATIQTTSVNSPTVTVEATITTTVSSGNLAYVPMGNDNSLALIDTVLHATIGTIDLTQFGCTAPQRARLTPDGAELYVMCNNSQNIIILETTNLSLVDAIDRPCGFEQDVVFVQNGAYALLSEHGCGGMFPIDVMDTATHNIFTSISTDYEIVSMSAHPFLPLAYAAGTQYGSSGAVVVIDTNFFTVQTTIPYGGFVWDVQTSPDGRWVYASEYYGTGLAKIDVSTNTIVDTLPGYGKFGLSISPDGSTIYATELWDSVVQVIDATNMELITTIGVGATTAESALTCDGSELYVARETASIPVIDTQTYSTTYEIPIPATSSAYGIAICPQYVAKGAFLNPPEQAKDGGRGEAVTYQETLYNNTGITQTFTLQALDNQWVTELSTGEISLLPNGASASFTITTTVPVDAPWYDTDSTTILATGVTSPELTAEAQLTTTAFAPAQISVTPGSLESTQFASEVTTQTLTINNGPGVPLTYDILEGISPDTVLLLHLDELEGSNMFNDSSLLNNDGSCTGDSCPIAGLLGQAGTAVQFDGMDDYIQTPTNGFPTGSADRTMAAWVKINSYVSGETFLVGYGNFDNMYQTYILMTQGTALCFSGWSSDFCGPELQTGRWYHIAVTSVGNFVTLYLDGIPVATGTPYFDTPGDTQLAMGRIPGYAGDERRLDGLIDEVIVLDRALNSDEIMAIYQGGLGGDVPWLSVDPVSGSVPTNGSTLVQVTFDATGLQPGVYETDLFITHNDPLQPMLSVPVTMIVTPMTPESVTITGPETGLVGQSQDFTATVLPGSTTLPLTYTWEAEGQPLVTHTGGLTDTVSFTWEIAGTQHITVTASNSAGSVSTTHQIVISPIGYSIYMPLVQKAHAGVLGISQLSEINGDKDSFPLNPAHMPHRK